MIWLIIGVLIAIVLAVIIICTISWYRIVDPSEAHLVVTPRNRFVVSPDEEVATDGRKTYFAISSWIPWFGRTIRAMDVTIKEIVDRQETIEKNQARYNVKTSTKYRIKDVQRAAETYISDQELEKQLIEIIRSSTRAMTVKYDVVDARAQKQTMENEIRTEMSDDFKKWGLELVNFQLVDFQDTEDSKIISNISKRREIEIESTTREQNAEKIKQAIIKEAETDEKGKQRQIERDRVVGEQEQIKLQMIAEKEKIAQEKHYDVVQVQIIKQAKIDKEKAIVEANQAKEQEAIIKKQKQLRGEGDRLMQEEQAKGEAAPIREKGFAEALAKDKLQEALNKFKDGAIKALVAEKIVTMQETVGVATAQALQKADVKLFSGGGKAGEDGFNLGKMIEAASVANANSAESVLNKIGRPNDMGFTALGMKALHETQSKTSETPKSEEVVDIKETIKKA